jgi:hypothetical protein
MLNPFGLILALIGRYIFWTSPKPKPRADPLGRQGAKAAG